MTRYGVIATVLMTAGGCGFIGTGIDQLAFEARIDLVVAPSSI